MRRHSISAATSIVRYVEWMPEDSEARRRGRLVVGSRRNVDFASRHAARRAALGDVQGDVQGEVMAKERKWAARILRENFLFTHMAPTTLASMLQCMEPVQLKAGETLFSVGGRDDLVLLPPRLRRDGRGAAHHHRAERPGACRRSVTARDFVLKLLTRDAVGRLGCGGGGVRDVMAHPLFAGTIDFDALLCKRVAPPHLPTVGDGEDTRNFDDEDSSETIDIAADPPYEEDPMAWDFFH